MYRILKFKHLIFIFFFLVTYLAIYGQQGNKYITNFLPTIYKASDQNWSSLQDKNGIMFFANLNGVLIYDGKKWQTIVLPLDKNVYSLDINGDNRVFVGADNEFGYLFQKPNGKFEYQSLSDSLLKSKNEFSAIWATYCIDQDVFFCANEKIFHLKEGKVTVYNPEKEKFHTFFNIGGHLFVREFDVGFKVFEDNELHFVLGSEIFADKKVYAFIPMLNNRYLLASRNGGLYLFNYNERHPSQSEFVKVKTDLDNWFNENELYCSRKISNNRFAFGSLKNGMIIIDSNLTLKTHINASNGLQDAAVKHISVDANHNIWLCLNNGISYFENSTPITYFGKPEGIGGVVENSIKFNNQLFISTDKGLMLYDKLLNKFSPTTITSPCYVLTKSSTKLFIATDEGTYEYNGKVFKLLNEESSYTCFYNYSNNQLYIGTDNALLILNPINEVVKRFDDIGAVRSIAFGKDGICALGTSADGVYILNNNILTNLGINEGLPVLAETNIFSLNGGIYISTNSGFCQFNTTYTKIIPSKEFSIKNTWVVDKAVQIKNQPF